MWEIMLKKARETMGKAHAPYSKFHVGACLQSISGEMYVGCNVENASYSMTIDAEASAIAQMVSSGEKTIQSILIVCYGDTPCAPCGACRQRIAEFSKPDTPVHMCCVTTEGEIKHVEVTIGSLMPHAFAASFLEE